MSNGSPHWPSQFIDQSECVGPVAANSHHPAERRQRSPKAAVSRGCSLATEPCRERRRCRAAVACTADYRHRRAVVVHLGTRRLGQALQFGIADGVHRWVIDSRDIHSCAALNPHARRGFWIRHCHSPNCRAACATARQVIHLGIPISHASGVGAPVLGRKAVFNNDAACEQPVDVVTAVRQLTAPRSCRRAQARSLRTLTFLGALHFY